MPSVEQLAAFVLASLVLIAAPGPDNLGVLSLGLSRGRAAGVGFALGCAAGCLTHTLWAALGVTALVAASPLAFAGLKYAGAAYLAYLGWRAFRNAGDVAIAHADRASAAPVRLAPYVLRGLLANALNPKVGLFFLAFLPQFIDASRPPAPQAVLLGALFAVMTAVAFGALGLYAGTLGRWLSGREHAGRWLDRAAGCVFIVLAGRLVLAKR